MSDRFEAFDSQHVTVLVLFLVGVLVVVVIGCRVRGTAKERVVNRVFAVGLLCVTVPLQIMQFLPAEWDPKTSLPLALCDLAWAIAAYALWTGSPLASTITYLWGITLTTQAMITPDLVSPFPEPRFIMFWAMHILIVWAAFYLVFGLRILPTWHTYRQTVAIALVWAAIAYLFNLGFGTNYGYLNAKPSQGSALDLLPSWPWYLPIEFGIVAAVWALLVWPWTRTAAKQAATDGASDLNS